jgi:hypothetical protein
MTISISPIDVIHTNTHNATLTHAERAYGSGSDPQPEVRSNRGSTALILRFNFRLRTIRLELLCNPPNPRPRQRRVVPRGVRRPTSD